MKKFVVAALLFVVFAMPAFAKKHHNPKPSHPQNIHAQNPNLNTMAP